MAERLEVSEATISRLASGERRPSIDVMIRIRDVLGWPLDNQADVLNISSSGWSHQFKWRMEALDGDTGN
jgi:transcriptional regulator with XRE-family HTH domain